MKKHQDEPLYELDIDGHAIVIGQIPNHSEAKGSLKFPGSRIELLSDIGGGRGDKIFAAYWELSGDVTVKEIRERPG